MLTSRLTVSHNNLGFQKVKLPQCWKVTHVNSTSQIKYSPLRCSTYPSYKVFLADIPEFSHADPHCSRVWASDRGSHCPPSSSSAQQLPSTFPTSDPQSCHPASLKSVLIIQPDLTTFGYKCLKSPSLSWLKEQVTKIFQTFRPYFIYFREKKCWSK